MITRYASEEPMARELLIAGIKPLPINRMMRQAGREVNDFTTKGKYGPFIRREPPRNAPRIQISQEQLDHRLMSDPSFKASYERQIERGLVPTLEDKYKINNYAFTPNNYNIQERPVDILPNGKAERRYRDEGKIPTEVKQRAIKRLERTQEAINNWDPIEASAAEDYNRMRGQNRRGDPSAAFDLIHTIDTPTHEGMSLGEMMVPRI